MAFCPTRDVSVVNFLTFRLPREIPSLRIVPRSFAKGAQLAKYSVPVQQMQRNHGLQRHPRALGELPSNHEVPLSTVPVRLLQHERSTQAHDQLSSKQAAVLLRAFD